MPELQGFPGLELYAQLQQDQDVFQKSQEGFNLLDASQQPVGSLPFPQSGLGRLKEEVP